MLDLCIGLGCKDKIIDVRKHEAWSLAGRRAACCKVPGPSQADETPVPRELPGSSHQTRPDCLSAYSEPFKRRAL